MSTIQTAPLSVSDTLTTCPFCSCACGLYLLHSGDRLTGVAPSAHHPVSHGHLCLRGWAAHEATQWGARLTTPLVRRQGELRPASWDEAIGEAAARLARIRDAGRGLGVIGSARATTEENFMAALLARSALRTGNLGMFPGYWTSQLARAALDASEGLTDATENADVVLVVEGDLAETHPRLASAAIHAVRRGARLVTIGAAPSRLTDLAAAHIGMHTRRPLDICDALLGAWREEYREASTEDVARTADWLHAARRTVILVGAYAPDALMVTATTAILTVLAHEIENAGAAARVAPLPPRANTMGAWWAGVAADRLPGGAALDDGAAQASLRALGGETACVDPGAPLAEILTSVAGLVLVKEDVVAHARRRHRAAAALSGLDTLVVLDSFQTSAAREAHVVLPVTAFGEVAGSTLGVEGGVQDVRATVRAPGEARAAWEVLADLGYRLGVPFTPARLDDVRAALQRFSGDRGAPVPMSAEVAGRQRRRRTWIGPDTKEPFVLMLDGGFDWGADITLTSSPSLRRDPLARHKEWTRGMVTLHPDDAAALQLREHGRVKVTSPTGSAISAVSIRPGQTRGTVLVPFAMRESFNAVLGDAVALAVELSGA